MKFKDWYAQADRECRDDNFLRPYIDIKNEEHYKLVIENLERLGFLDGNDFSKYGVPVTHVDIWYNDFWNSHISKRNADDLDFEFTLDELIAVEKREGF